MPTLSMLSATGLDTVGFVCCGRWSRISILQS